MLNVPVTTLLACLALAGSFARGSLGRWPPTLTPTLPVAALRIPSAPTTVRDFSASIANVTVVDAPGASVTYENERLRLSFHNYSTIQVEAL